MDGTVDPTSAHAGAGGAGLELAAADERLYDFCLWEYEPPAPAAGKLRAVNLLARSFELEGVGGRGAELIAALRRGLGDSRTVWGIKLAGGQVSWELYFYDYDRLERTRSVPRVLEILRPLLPCEVVVSDRQPYFMFSLDIGAEQLRRGGAIDEIQMYIGNIGSSVSSGICYTVRREATRLKNFYFFFDAACEMENIRGKLTSSAYIDPQRQDLDEILWPGLVDCAVIVVANKIDRDGVYFSRVNVDQLLHFLKRMRYPAGQVAFVERHRDRLDHLLFDVGFDYRLEGGRLAVVKSAWYASF